MKILTIAVWNESGAVRRIDLTSGLNIITGASGTGKSALIDIVRYCLGSSELNIPQGPITETVKYFGLLIEIDGTRAFIGRPALDRHQQSGTAVQLEIGVRDLPSSDGLKLNTNREALRTWIGRTIGIEENSWQPAEGETRNPLVAALPHALIHCFQRQDEIASRTNLFHQQGEDFMPAAIRDTLPYFLGVTGPDQLRDAAQLRELRKQRTQIERKRADVEAVAGSSSTKSRRLLQQAVGAGLAESATPDEPPAQILSRLRKALDTTAPDVPAGASAAEFDRLRAERQSLLQHVEALTQRRQVAVAIARTRDDVEHESVEQIVRLQSLRLLPEPGEPEACPVCTAPLQDPPPAVVALNASLESLDKQIAEVERDRPGLVAFIAEIDKDESGTRDALRENKRQLEELARADEAVGVYEERMARSAWVRGRIDHYLETVDETLDVDTSSFDDEHSRLCREIDALTEALDPGRIRDAATSMLANIGRPMTDKALRLALEHAKHGVRIDLSRLTVVVDDPEGPIYMSLGGIGSGKNWIGYHLAATLSLQEHFVRQTRPVPRFLMLDQPTQAFFPSDRPMNEVDDQDRTEARAQFELLRDVASNIDNALQIIVLDHADFPESWFQGAVRERWRDGAALIPADWIEAANEASHDTGAD